jgi:hypothetical protein
MRHNIMLTIAAVAVFVGHSPIAAGVPGVAAPNASSIIEGQPALIEDAMYVERNDNRPRRS